jgi:DNA polymerase III subunit gamma/tau
MSYQVIARKYRPQRFADVVGQDHVTQTLGNAIRQNRIAHAYLFVGPRGTGKTTIARIFAKCLNCTDGPKVDFSEDDPRCKEISEGRSLDVLEIDGASNRGIEEIRALRETVKFAPATGRFKIYIIDEVHMLTKEAFNALLKTLEEPPEHVKFMFATTEPEKILPTILSRCQRYDLRRIPVALIVKHLGQIAQLESVKVEESALFVIARSAEGCMRDAESTLDQLISFCGNEIGEPDVVSMFGMASRSQIQSMAEAVFAGNLEGVLRGVDALSRNGKDLGLLLSDLLNHARNLLLYQLTKGDLTLLEVTETEAAKLSEQASLVDSEALTRIMEVLVDGESRLRDAVSKKTLVEITMVKAVQARQAVSIDSVLKQLRELRSGNEGALPAANPTPQQPAPRAIANVVASASVAPVASVVPAPAKPVFVAVAPPSAPAVVPTATTPTTPAPLTPIPAPAVPVAPVASVTPATVVDLASLWTGVLDCVSRISLFTHSYLVNAHPVSFERQLLTIGFPPEFADQIDLVDNAKNRKIIQGVLQDLGHGEVNLKMVKTKEPATRPVPTAARPAPAIRQRKSEPAAASGSPAPSNTKAEAAAAKPPVITMTREDFKNDPLIKQALEIFKGQLVEIKS